MNCTFPMTPQDYENLKREREALCDSLRERLERSAETRAHHIGKFTDIDGNLLEGSDLDNFFSRR